MVSPRSPRVPVIDVVMRDVSDEFLERGMAAIDKSLQRDVDKERLAADEKHVIRGRIQDNDLP